MHSESLSPADTSSDQDQRLYLSHPEGWQAHVKQDWEKEYCFAKNPGEDFFHLILCGEVYLQRGDEIFCLNCALRQGVLTRDRLSWQHGPRKQSGQVL